MVKHLAMTPPLMVVRGKQSIQSMQQIRINQSRIGLATIQQGDWRTHGRVSSVMEYLSLYLYSSDSL